MPASTKSTWLRHAALYGLVGGTLILLLNLTEYRFLVIEHSVQIYAAIIAIIFATLGIWLGNRLTAKPAPPIATQPIPVPFLPDEARREAFGITRREFEILQLIAQGLSNREIAEKLFVSENTIKTHSSRVLDKLGAKRRTQAVQLAKDHGLLA